MPPVMDTDQGVGQYRGTEDWGGEPHLHQHDQAMHTSTDDPRDMSGPEQCSDTSGVLLPWEERSSDIEVRCLDVSDRKISPNTGDLSKERHSSTGVMHDEQGSSMDESDGTHWKCRGTRNTL